MKKKNTSIMNLLFLFLIQTIPMATWLCDAFIIDNRSHFSSLVLKKQGYFFTNNRGTVTRLFVSKSSSELRKILRQRSRKINDNKNVVCKDEINGKRSENRRTKTKVGSHSTKINNKRKKLLTLPKEWWNNPEKSPEYYLVNFDTATFAFQQLALGKTTLNFSSQNFREKDGKSSQLIADIITIIMRHYRHSKEIEGTNESPFQATSFANLLYALMYFQLCLEEIPAINDIHILMDIVLKEKSFWMPRVSPRRLVRQCLPCLDQRSNDGTSATSIDDIKRQLQEEILQTLQKTHILGELSARDLSHVFHHCALATIALESPHADNIMSSFACQTVDYQIFLKRMQKLRLKCTMTDVTRTFWSLQQLLRYQQELNTKFLITSRKFVYTFLKEQENDNKKVLGDRFWQPRQLADVINAASQILLFMPSNEDNSSEENFDENMLIYRNLMENFASQNVLESIQQQLLSNNKDDNSDPLSDIIKLLSSVSSFSSSYNKYENDGIDSSYREGWRLQIVSLVGQEISRQGWASAMTMPMWCKWLHYSIKIVSSSSPIQSAATRLFLLQTLHFHFPRHYIQQCTDARQLASLLQSLSTLLYAHQYSPNNEEGYGDYNITDDSTMCEDMILPCLQQIQNIHNDSKMDTEITEISPSLTSWILTSSTKLVKSTNEKVFLWDTFHTLGDSLLMAETSDLSIRDISNVMFSMAKATYTQDLGIFDHLSYLLSTSIQSSSTSVDDDENELVLDATTMRHVVKALWACGKMISWEDPLRETMQYGKFTPPMYLLNAKRFARFVIEYSNRVLEEAKEDPFSNHANGTISHKDIAQSIWALGRLQITDLDIIQPMSLLAKHVTPYCNSQEIANMLWGLAKSELPIHDKSMKNKKFVSIKQQKQHYEQKQQLDENYKVIQTLISPFSSSDSTEHGYQIRQEDITSQEAVNIMYALGRFRLADRPTFSYMNEVLKQQISTTTSQAIANTLWAHQAVNIVPDRAVVDKWAQEKLDLTTITANINIDLGSKDPLQEGN